MGQSRWYHYVNLESKEESIVNETKASTSSPLQTLIEALHLAAVLFGLIVTIIAL